MTGISLTQLFSKTIPRPTHTLKSGVGIPSEVMEALRNGETALLKGEFEDQLILMSTEGTLMYAPMTHAEQFMQPVTKD